MMKKTILLTLLLAVISYMGGEAFALEQDAAGVYQIGTAQDLIDFASFVNDKTDGVDNSAASAVLTADIDLKGVEWIPIGTADRRYRGTFDGQGHAVKNMTLRTNVKEQGLFSVCDTATLKYIVIDKSCTVRSYDAPTYAALVGCCNGDGTFTIIGCVNYADVRGSQKNNAAFIGYNYGGTDLKVNLIYCVNYGNISGGWENGVFCGGFGGGSGSKVYGCLNFGSITDHQDNLTLGRSTELSSYICSYDLNPANNPDEAFVYPNYSDDVARSGQLCYDLNSYPGVTGWYQTIGEDDFPVLDATHKQVYASGEAYCDGEPKGTLTYSNEESSVVLDAHVYEDGYCKHCHQADPDFLTIDEEGFYLIENAAQLQWIARRVNDGHPDVNVRLMNDIDMTGIVWEPIGTNETNYSGTFDGQFHRIRNLVIDDPDNEIRGLFGYIGPAYVKHVIIDSSCSFRGLKKVAAFAGVCAGQGVVTFDGCGNEANVTGISTANGNNAVFIGCNYCDGKLKADIRYCWNTGNVGGGSENGIFSGWFANAATLTSCWNTGTLTEGEGYNSLGRGIDLSCLVRAYDLNDDNLRQECTIPADFKESMIADGTFCFLLNGNQTEIGWYQTLGVDPVPVPDDSHLRVYGNGHFFCDGTPKSDVTYSNTDGGAEIDEHNYINGFCDHCGKADPSATIEQDAEGYYHVSTGVEFNLFASLTQKDGTLKCKFDADIDMDGLAYNPLGTMGTTFCGEIDGQGHRVLNLIIDAPDARSRGLVGLFTGGLIVRNLIMDESCSITADKYSAAVAGEGSGSGDALFQNVGNEASVTGTGINIGGIVGVNMGSGCHFVLENCYNTGDIIGGGESAALSGWLGSSAVVTNCWNSGFVSGIQSGKPLARYSSATFTNCYNIEGTEQDHVGTFAYDDLESGALCWYLNGKMDGGEEWFQTIGEDYWPIPFSNGHEKVYTAGSLLCNGEADPDGDFAYTNTPGEVIRPDHQWHDGVCDVCGWGDPEWKELDEEGWYNLADEHDLQWFSAMVKRGNVDIKGRLTDDIDLSGIEWSPIGNEEKPFKGAFDGQCHYIDNLDVVGDECMGFFGCITGGADIRNFIINGAVSGGAFCGGVAGAAIGEGKVFLTNLGNEASVTGSAQNAAGILGVSKDPGCTIIMTACYNAGDVDGKRESAALCGWTGSAESELSHCYNIGTVSGYDSGKPLYRRDCSIKDLVCTNADSQQGIVVSDEAVLTGELAFYVNGMQAEGKYFFQTLDVDDYPVPFSEGHETVYAHGKLMCDGTVDEDGLSFSNEPGEFEHAEHQFGEDGCCEICGNAWGISTAEQLLEFSWNVQSYITNEAEVYLLNDIDLKDVEWEPIGYGGTESDTEESIPFAGKFDGQGHRILNMTIDDPSRQFLGFFGCLMGGAEVRNLIIDKSCYVHGDAYCAGFAGGSKHSGIIIFENCGNECDVLCDGSKGINAAGFVGCNMNSSATFVINNCFNTGNIKGQKESAAFCGWLGSNARVTNCWNTGNVDGIENGKPFARYSSVTFTNCYDLKGSQSNVNRLTSSSVTSGELCYKLNKGNTDDPVWRQTIGVDPYPTFNPESGIVYFIDYEYMNSTGIEPILDGNPDGIVGTYTLQGLPSDGTQRGIHIVRKSDGTVCKVLVK